MIKEQDDFAFVGIKMRKGLVKLMDAFIEHDTHTNRSELIRQALREKIQRDAPEIWKKYMSDNNDDDQVEAVEVTE